MDPALRPDGTRLFNKTEIAEILGCSRPTAQNFVRNNNLPVVRMGAQGKRELVRESDLYTVLLGEVPQPA